MAEAPPIRYASRTSNGERPEPSTAIQNMTMKPRTTAALIDFSNLRSCGMHCERTPAVSRATLTRATIVVKRATFLHPRFELAGCKASLWLLGGTPTLLDPNCLGQFPGQFPAP